MLRCKTQTNKTRWTKAVHTLSFLQLKSFALLSLSLSLSPCPGGRPSADASEVIEAYGTKERRWSVRRDQVVRRRRPPKADPNSISPPMLQREARDRGRKMAVLRDARWEYPHPSPDSNDIGAMQYIPDKRLDLNRRRAPAAGGGSSTTPRPEKKTDEDAIIRQKRSTGDAAQAMRTSRGIRSDRDGGRR